jgi:hypothetical protein
LCFQAGRRTAHLNHAPPCEPAGANAGLPNSTRFLLYLAMPP